MKVKQYSVDVKNIITKMRLSGKSFRAIQHITGISKSSAHRWITQHAVHKRHCTQHARTVKWTQSVAQDIADYVSQNPFCTLERIRTHLRTIADTHVSIPRSTSTIRNWLRKLNISRKRAERSFVVSSSRIVDLQQSFKSSMRNTCLQDFVSIDETSLYFNDVPKYGYCKRGQRLRRKTVHPSDIGRKRVSLLLAVSAKGVVAYGCFPGSYDSKKFAQFIRDLPTDCPKNILMDNVAFHKSAVSRAAYTERSFNPIFVPPYSPQFNPIEYLFSAIKTKWRQLNSVACAGTDIQNLLSNLESVLRNIPDTSFHNVFAHCWKLCARI